MSPIEFAEQTLVIAKDQPEYVPLPSYAYKDDVEGKVVFCWELSAVEIQKLIETRKIWHTVLTFNDKLQPQLLSVDKPEMPLYGHPKRRRIRPDEVMPPLTLTLTGKCKGCGAAVPQEMEFCQGCAAET